MDDGDDDDTDDDATDDDTDDDHDDHVDTDEDNDHQNDSYTAAGAAPGACVPCSFSQVPVEGKGLVEGPVKGLVMATILGFPFFLANIDFFRF